MIFNVYAKNMFVGRLITDKHGDWFTDRTGKAIWNSPIVERVKRYKQLNLKRVM